MQPDLAQRFMALVTQMTAVMLTKPPTEQQAKLLAQDLPREMVKSLPGKKDRDGRPIGYVSTHYVIERLNTVFGHEGWSIEYGTVVIREGDRPILYVPTTLRVHALGIVKGDIGVGLAANGSPDSFETAIKAAYSDGLKRTARMLGPSFGLALYDKEQTDVGYSFACQELLAAYDAVTDSASLDEVGGRVRKVWKELPKDEQTAIFNAQKLAAARVLGETTPPTQSPAQQSAKQPVTTDDALISRLKGARSIEHLLAMLLTHRAQTSDRVWTVAVRMAHDFDGTTEEQLRTDLGQRANAAKPEEWRTVAAFLGEVLGATDTGGVDGAVTKHSVLVKALPDRVQRLCTSTAIFHRMSLRIASAPDDATLKQIHANLATFVTGGKLGKVQAELLTNLMNERAERLAVASQDQAA